MKALERLIGLEFFLGACAAVRGFWTFAIGVQHGVPGQDAIVATIMLLVGLIRMGLILGTPTLFFPRSLCAIVLSFTWLYVGFDASLKGYTYTGQIPTNVMMAAGSMWIYLTLRAQLRRKKEAGA